LGIIITGNHLKTRHGVFTHHDRVSLFLEFQKLAGQAGNQLHLKAMHITALLWHLLLASEKAEEKALT
jgi:hypothetical protein